MYQIKLLDPNEAKAYRVIRLEALKNHPDCFAADYQGQKVLPILYFEHLIKGGSTKEKIAELFIKV